MKLVQQKKRGQYKERNRVINDEVDKLVSARIVQELFPSLVANSVLVEKGDKQWIMCVDFTDLNKACLNDFYPLEAIDGSH